jgi:hypothetical protein
MEESLKIYCKDCKIVTEHRVKGARERVLVCNICNSTNMPVTLVKSNGEIHHGTQVKFIEWQGEELGSRAKKLHEEPQVGYSVIIDPQYRTQYTWLTTPIVEIESDVETETSRCITLKTKNSEYKLYITK